MNIRKPAPQHHCTPSFRRSLYGDDDSTFIFDDYGCDRSKNINAYISYLKIYQSRDL
ncbi:hypothetical protein [Komarekiella delphini-convector]|uniref:hypothetical protein n=1 Tax=Komarekiella delphini-convector TaxID=3050158 RepID=UPI00177E3C1D|nr:hypothetical protein [Komarekiella delphini-convector]